MRAIIIAVALLLSGCSYGSYSVSSGATKEADLHFVGVPTLAGAVGSSFPIGNGYSLTAKHVARMMLVKVVAYHPTCDIAVIRSDSNTKPHAIRPAVIGESVRAYGYAAMLGAAPVESAGKAMQWGWLDDSYSSKCPAMTMSAGVAQGMSGGAVLGADGKAVAVTQGYNSGRGFSIAIPVQSFAPWLEKVTGIKA